MSIFKRTLSSSLSGRYSGMSGLWGRIKDRWSRTEAIVQKLKLTAQDNPSTGSQKVTDHADNPSNLNSRNTVTSTNLVDQVLQGKRPWTLHNPPKEYWMQSPYVRGSTQKMTDLARRIIGLPLDAALLQMRFCEKKKAKVVLQVLSNMKMQLRRWGANTSYYYIKSATVGRGTYLKRLDIKGRGRHGVEWRGHTFIRIGCHCPNPQTLVRKLLKIKKIPREDKPIMKRLDYY